MSDVLGWLPDLAMLALGIAFGVRAARRLGPRGRRALYLAPFAVACLTVILVWLSPPCEDFLDGPCEENWVSEAATKWPWPSDARCDGRAPASVRGVEFSRELRDDVLGGDITLSVRLWQRPQVKEGGRYRVGLGLIEIDAIELVPFSAITEEDVRRAGEPDRETLRDRAAHAGPIDEDTLVYRIELHAVSPGG
jgi:hypothetical protein